MSQRPITTADEAEILNSYAEGKVSPNTRRSYEHAWSHWETRAAAKGFDPYKATGRDLAMWLAVLARSGLALSTVRQRRNAVSWHYRQAGLDDIGKEAIVENALTGIRREKGTAQEQARPLREQHLRPILKTLARRHANPTDKQTARIMRDVAILYTMRNGLLRVSEAAGLRWEHIRWDPDGRGALYLPKSKGDQFGAGVWLSVSAETMNHLRDWMMAGPQTLDFGQRGPVFVGQRGGAMLPTRFGKIIKRLCVETFGPEHGAGFKGHSPRVGMAVDLREVHGMSLQDIKIAGRWSSIDLVLRYLAEYEARRDPMAML